MPERRASRFALEVLFLVALAAALTFANLRALAVVGLMLLGWIFVAFFEWASMRSESHYGSGLPPRYFVPRVSLPPSLPLDRTDPPFPVAERRGDASTWLAPAAADDGGGDWPWRGESEPPPAAEETEIGEPVEAVTSVGIVVEVDAVAQEDEAEPPMEPERRVEVEPVLGREPASGSGASLAEPGASGVLTARHRIDPLEPTPGGRRRRRRDENDGVIEVPARPTVRVLPGTSRREE